MVVLPTMAVMRTDVTETKGDNLAWMGSKNKGRERKKKAFLGRCAADCMDFLLPQSCLD